jgi:hypothetical protein
MRNRRIDCDAMKPSGKPGISAKTIERSMNLDKNILSQIIQLYTRTDNTYKKPADRAHVVHEQIPKRFHVPASGP